ncbi:MAG: polymer-forming cytoskeletal protein [Pseudomonadota bacterium]
MFKKSRSQESAVDTVSYEADVSPRPVSHKASVLGPTLVFKGELHAEEDLVIEGRIEGSIQHQEKNLTIGPQGVIKADINAKVITVEGTVEGDLSGDVAVVLRATARVKGNLSAPRIVIEDGAQLNGRVDTSGEAPVPGYSETDDDYAAEVSYEAAG